MDKEQREEFEDYLTAAPDGAADTSEERLLRALYDAAAREDHDDGQSRDDLC
jgi:hypothetical protein